MNIRQKLLLKLTDKGNSLPIEIRHNEMFFLRSGEKKFTKYSVSIKNKKRT